MIEENFFEKEKNMHVLHAWVRANVRKKPYY